MRLPRWVRCPAAVAAVIFALPAVANGGETSALDRVAHPPLGLPAVPFPASNPPTSEKIALGRKLFFDARLSTNGAQSCGSCHKPSEAFTQNDRSAPTGASGRPLRRNAPTVINSAFKARLMLDGEAPSLEAQVLTPLFAADEMGNPNIKDFVARIAAFPDYRRRFEAAFDQPASMATIGKAIASYERSLVSGNAPFDKWYFARVSDALSPDAQKGFELFSGKAGCVVCHSIGQENALFTDQSYHNSGIGSLGLKRRAEDRPADLGREAVTHDAGDRFKYATPSLRNVAMTAPYMHDGSLPTLDAVVRFYNSGGAANSGLDPAIHPLGLNEHEIAALVAFLEGLTGEDFAAVEGEAQNIP